MGFGKMKREDVKHAKDLIKSILTGLYRLDKGSEIEEAYLSEKIRALYNLQFKGV